MEKKINPLFLAISIIVVFGLFAVFILPFFPIDETRYLTVAWEMKLKHSFLVPFLNGETYSHKPPFLFWMINILWAITGVNDFVPRIVPIVFSVLSIIITFKITEILFEDDKELPGYSALVLSSLILWMAWSTLVMFDIILTFFSILAIYQFLKSLKKEKPFSSFLLAGLSMGVAIIVKGPVVFVHTLPFSIAIPFIFPLGEAGQNRKKWFAWLFFSVIISVATALLWAVPAAISGGESYAEAIFWGQTANRVVSSFAHKRAFWWYLPLVPLITFPWGMNFVLWKDLFTFNEGRGEKLLKIWLFSSFIIFSLISGKQIHYLIPELPCFAILFAVTIKKYISEKKMGLVRKNMAGVFLIIGISLFILPLFNLGSDIGNVNRSDFFILSSVSFLLGLFIFLKGKNSGRLILLSSAASFLFMITFLFSTMDIFKRYDLSGLSSFIKSQEKKGVVVAHYGEYAGQYTFYGRLERKVAVIDTRDDLKKFADTHGDFILVQFTRKNIPEQKGVLFKQPYTDKYAVVWSREGAISGIE